MGKDKSPKYVSLEPNAFLSDKDFQLMNAEERGVYCTIIFYLYSNGGKIEKDEKVQTRRHAKDGDLKK